jgi:hypothetical protein
MSPNRRDLFLLTAALASAPALASADDDDATTVQRQVNELNDAITYGRSEVWARYLHEAFIYTDEDGAVSTKAQLVPQITPLPTGVSGNLSLVDYQTHRAGDTLISTYIIDEHEAYHGAQLHCQYRNTMTWIKMPDGWRLLAGQSLALRTDPAEIALTVAQQAEYVGTYRLDAQTTYTVTRGADGLTSQQTGGHPHPLKAEVRDMLFNPGRPRYRYVFMRDAHGRITHVIERREAWDMVWTRET